MNAIADALGLGKLPSSVLYVVVGLVSGATTSVSFIRLPKQFSHQVLVFSLLVARARPLVGLELVFPIKVTRACPVCIYGPYELVLSLNSASLAKFALAT